LWNDSTEVTHKP